MPNWSIISESSFGTKYGFRLSSLTADLLMVMAKNVCQDLDNGEGELLL